MRKGMQEIINATVDLVDALELPAYQGASKVTKAQNRLRDVVQNMQNEIEGRNLKHWFAQWQDEAITAIEVRNTVTEKLTALQKLYEEKTGAPVVDEVCPICFGTGNAGEHEPVCKRCNGTGKIPYTDTK